MKFKLFLCIILCNTVMASSFIPSKPVFNKKIEQKNFSSNLPLVIMNLMDEKRVHSSYSINAKMRIIEPTDANRSHVNLLPTYKGMVSIKNRGSSSERFPKKQYGFITQTKDGRNDNVSLLGMPHEHKWILNAPYSDKTLMRNYLAYHKTREIDESKYYAVRSHFVEVLFERKDCYTYEGIYVLMEKIKQGKERVKIKKVKKLRKQRITGGYILKLDKPATEIEHLDFKENERFLYQYPKDEKISNVQKLFISKYLYSFQNALYSDDFNLTTSPNYYGKWIDEDSFIVHFLSRELFLDSDIWMYSEYLYKDENQKLFLGPVWDFNLGMGNDNYRFSGNYQVFGYKQFVNGAPYTLSSWMQRLMSDPIFYQKVRMKWKKLRRGIWSTHNFIDFIDKTKEKLDEGATRNFIRWRRVFGRFVWPNRKTCKDGIKNIYCTNFESAVEYDLKIWLIRRLDWLDKEFNRFNR